MVIQSAEVLQRARVMSGLSQRELVEHTGVSQPVISAYERRLCELSLSMLFKPVNATCCELSMTVEQPDAQPEQAHIESLRRRGVHRCRDTIVAVANRRGARKVRLFGSISRGHERETSDIDLLVHIDAGVSLVELIDLEHERTQFLGCSADVVPARNLKPDVAQHVRAEAIPP